MASLFVTTEQAEKLANSLKAYMDESNTGVSGLAGFEVEFEEGQRVVQIPKAVMAIRMLFERVELST